MNRISLSAIFLFFFLSSLIIPGTAVAQVETDGELADSTGNDSTMPKPLPTPEQEKAPTHQVVPTQEDYANVNAGSEKGERKSSSTSTYTALIQTIVFLIVLIIVVWIVIRIIKKRKGVTFLDNDSIKVLSTSTIALQKYVQVVEIAGRVYILGITDQQVNTLGEITDKETIDELRVKASSSVLPNYKQSFSNVFGSMFGKNTSTQKTEIAPIKGFLNVLQKQKDRLNKLNT